MIKNQQQCKINKVMFKSSHIRDAESMNCSGRQNNSAVNGMHTVYIQVEFSSILHIILGYSNQIIQIGLDTAMSSQSLKYGHIIRIKSNDIRTLSYITSKSYTDPKLYFQTYGYNNYDDGESKLDVSNYRESLFEVLPTSSFEINDQMNAIKNQAKRAESVPRAKTEQEQFKTIIEEKKGKSIYFGDKVVFRHLDSKHYVYGSFECAQSGIGAFKIQLREELSEKIIFQLLSYRTYEKDGDQISIDAPLKIYHAQTQCFMSFCMEEIFLDRLSEKERPQEFRERAFVDAMPQLKLFHTKKVDEKEVTHTINEEGQGKWHNQRKMKQQLLQQFPDESSRYQIINENIAKRIWKFEPYIDVELKANRQIIRDHDIVYLLHTKDDKYLSPNNFNTKIILNKRIDAADSDMIFDGLWQIEQRTQIPDEEGLGKSKMPNKKGIPNFLSATVNPNLSMTMNVSTRKMGMKKQDEKQSEASKKKSYSLRHLMSGRLLYFTQNKKKQMFDIELVHSGEIQALSKDPLKYASKQGLKDGTKDAPKEITRFGFVLLECLDSSLADGTLTRLNIDSGKAYLEVKSKQQQKKSILQLQLKESHQLDDEKFQFLIDESEIEKNYESNFQKQDLEPTKDASEHGFRIYKAEESIKQIALKIMSSQEVIYKFTDFISDYTDERDSKILNMSLLNNVINVIKDLIGFILGCDYSKIISSGNSPNSLKQRAFDELGMVEVITVMLNEIQEKDKVLKNIESKASEYKKIRTIYVLGYEVLESMAAYNLTLKIKISKYLHIYLKHILEPHNRVVYKSIQEIMDGNDLALHEEVHLNYINELIGSFGQGDSTTPADLQFLSRLCLCKNRTVKKNQDAVFLAFYESAQNDKNKFFFKADHGKYQIASRISKKQDIRLRTLPELYLECEMSEMDGVLDPSKSHWKYFMQYLNLLADVCVGRNSSPLRYITENLPLKTLEQFLQQKIIRNQLLHQPFIRLVHHAFVETEIFKQISRITKVKNWNTLGDKNQIPKASAPVSTELGIIIDLITSYIKKINKESWEDVKKKKTKLNEEEPTSIVFNPEDMQSLYSVDTFLEILKSTLILGFWPTMDSIKKLVPYMLKIISFDFQYAKVIEERARTNNEFIYVSEVDFKTKVYKKVKQELRLNKPNIVLLVRCKILAAQILDIIIDYQFNIRVSSITNYFRKVQEQEVDLRMYPFDEWAFKKKWRNDREFSLFVPENEKEGYLMNEQLWIDQINRTIEEGDVFRYCKQGEYDINFLLVLFEAFIYGNQELTDLIIKILIRVTSERKGLLNTFKEIILVAGGNLNKLTDRVLKTRSTLLKLTSQQVTTERYSSNNLWNKIFGSDLSSEKKELGTIQELAFLTMAMKKGSNPTQAKASKFYEMTDLYPFKDFTIGGDDSKDYFDKSYLIINEKEENNPLNQNLIKSQDHHLLILSFIKLTHKVTKDDQQFYLLALHASYNFLTVLVWNNIENKNELEHFLAEAENHLAINVGCIDFFQEMYKNNKKLVIKTDVTRIVNRIIQLANELNFCEYYHKSKLLDFLRNIIIFDNKGVAKNQNIVMEIISQYQVSDNNQIVYLKVEEGISAVIEKNYKEWVKGYEKDYFESLKNYTDLYISPQLFYIATFFQIFSGLIENENKVNIGKCTNMHPHNFLIKLISNYHKCWPVVRHLRSYINKLYYMGHEKETQLFIDFLQTDLRNIEQEMKDLIILIANSPDYNTIRIKNPIRYTFLGSYVFLALEECLNSLSLMLQDEYFHKFLIIELGQESSYSEPHYFVLLFIMEMIQYLMKTIDGRYINKYMARVSKLIRDAVAQTPLKTVEKYMEIQKNKIAENMRLHHFSADEVMYRKNYIFHDNKGFWRHLIDWNAHYHQELQREKAISAISKKTDKEVGAAAGAPDAEQKKRRDYLLEKISLGNIQKLILIRDPQKRQDMDKDKEQKNEDYESKEKQKNIEETEDMLPKNLITSQSQRFKVKNERFDNPEVKNMIINSRRKKLVKFIEVNPLFNKFSEEETKNILYKGFSELSEMSYNKYGIEVVGKSDVIKTLVEMNKKDSKSIKIQFKVEIVKMLTAFIQKQSSVFNKNIEEWLLTDLDECERVRTAQNYLNDCNCSDFLCSLFQNDLNTSIHYTNEIIMFGICLLMGKNENVQKKVLQILQKDDKNVILLQLGELIKKNELNTELFNLSAKSTEKFETSYSDTYDFYVDNEKTMERKFTYIPQTVLEQKQLEQKMIFLQRVFIFLKVLCEGSNQEIKNYIREQTSSDQEKRIKTESINFIGLSAAELKRLLSDFKIEVIKVSYAIVDFIYEVTQIPCVNNQLFLCKNTTYFHDFAQLERSIETKILEKTLSSSDIKLLNDFFARNIKNCISCLQGNHEEIRQSLIADDLPAYYVSTFNLFMNELQQEEGYKFSNALELETCMNKHNIFSGKILHLFDIVTVMVKLKSKYKRFEDHVKLFLDKTDKRKHFELFEKQLLGIEIHMDKGEAGSDETQIEYFPRHYVYNYLSRATRNTIMEEINRSTQRDKIIGLINTTPVIQQEIDYNFILDHEYKFLGFPVSISATKIGIYQNIALVFSILICMLMVLFVNVIYYPYDEAIEYDLGNYRTLIKILSTIQFIFAIVYTTLWVFNHSKLAIGKYELEVETEAKKESSLKDLLFKIPGLKSLYCLAAYDTEFSGILLFIVGSSLGNLYRPEWFSMLIISMMMSSMDVLKNMIASITTKIKILGMLSLLGTAFIGIFSIFSINFYVGSLYKSELPKEHCMSVIDCIVELYIKEEIGSEMESFKPGRFFFDMVYTIFMELLFGNIVSGVLIDTFTELREKREEINKDKEGMCFICGISKEILQKKNENIKTHYRFHFHKLWNYVFYIYNLNLKRDKVGLEYIISEKIKNEDVTWVPVVSGEQEDIGEKIQELQTAIEEQKKFIEQIESPEV